MVRAVLMVMMLLAGVAWAEPPDGPPPPPPRHDDSDRGRDRDDDRGRDRDRDGRDGRSLSPEETADALAVLKRIDPEEAARLEAKMEKHPDYVASELRRRFPRIEWFLKLKKWDSEMFDLRVEDLRLVHETSVLARQIRRAESAEEPDLDPDTLRDQLETRLEEHFAIRQRIRERELTHLERRIEQLREELEEREDEQDKLIEQRMAELLRDRDDSDW